MIRRILAVSGVGVALVVGARLGVGHLAERAWDARRAELEALALHPPELKRPWEVRFEALQARLRESPRFNEIVSSDLHARRAWGTDDPHLLDDTERVWVEALWNELTGLDGILRELRKLHPDDAAGSGVLVSRLGIARELTNALCGRAWQALGQGDSEGAAVLLADALRLARATDEGTTMGTMIRQGCESIVLRAARASLRLGASPADLRATLGPLLALRAYDPELAQRAIRRDLAFLESGMVDEEITGGDPSLGLSYFRGVEHALEVCRTSARESAAEWSTSSTSDEGLWIATPRTLHALHTAANVKLTGLAVAAFAEEHGRWPATLDEIPDLPPEHALDPLRGAPLPYEVTGDGARVGPAAWGERVEPPEHLERSLYVWRLE